MPSSKPKSFTLQRPELATTDLIALLGVVLGLAILLLAGSLPKFLEAL